MVFISVDTAKDSPEQIRATIAYLQQLLGEESVVSAVPARCVAPVAQPTAAPADSPTDFLSVDALAEMVRAHEQPAAQAEQRPAAASAAATASQEMPSSTQNSVEMRMSDAKRIQPKFDPAQFLRDVARKDLDKKGPVKPEQKKEPSPGAAVSKEPEAKIEVEETSGTFIEIVEYD